MIVTTISSIILLLFLQHVAKCTSDQSNFTTSTTNHNHYYYTATTPAYRTTTTGQYCLSYTPIYEIPYYGSSYLFVCSNTGYMRFSTYLVSSRAYQLRVTAKSFTTTSNDYYNRGFWIANSYKTWNFRPDTDSPRYKYQTNCQYSGCSFTADPNTDVDILMYFGAGSTNSYWFTIEDITPPASSNLWIAFVVFLLLLFAVGFSLVLIGRYIRMQRIARSNFSARMNQIPDGPVVTFESAEVWHQNLSSTPTIPTFETEDDKIPVPDGPRVNNNIH